MRLAQSLSSLLPLPLRASRLLFVLPLLLLSCSEPNPFLGVCGNSLVEPEFGEQCDDGADNSNSVSSCTEQCQFAACGDGFVLEGVEECDLAGENSNSGKCTEFCTIQRCGDGWVQDGEQCDDGEENRWPPDGQGGCSKYCSSLSTCGNGEVEQTEACDDGNDVETDACIGCIAAVCGDGIVYEGVEACDDGDADDSDSCLSNCDFAQCGDGVVHEGTEECDDGNQSNSDGCLVGCQAAFCGDGVLYEGVEECDDGNLEPDDGCNAECISDREVFVTKEYLKAGKLMGLKGADALCQAEAELYELAYPERFKAWLSDSKESPSTRFTTRNARYVLVNGAPIADDWNDLTDGQLSHAIDRSADGAIDDVIVWTATLASGEPVDTDDFCGDWSMSGESFIRQGASSVTDSEWTALALPGFCLELGHLYCFRD